VIVALALTGCTGDGDTPSPSPSPTESSSASASPTPGTVVGKGTFALTLPEGWTEQAEAGGALLLGISNQAVDGYPTNVNVVADTTLVPIAPEQLAAHRTAILGEGDATDVADQGTYLVDGEPGARLSYQQRFNGIDVVSTEISVSHEDVGYIVTFSFAPSVAATSRNALVDKMMSTWTWSP